MRRISFLAMLMGLIIGGGLVTSAPTTPESPTATSHIWIQRSFILSGEPDLELFGDDELGTICELLRGQPFADRVSRSERFARIPGGNDGNASRRVMEGLAIKRAADPKQPFLTLTFSGPDRGQNQSILQAIIETIPGYINDTRQSAWEMLLRNQDTIRERAEARVKKAEEYWVELHRKAPAELANGNLEARQAALALRERELALREHDLTIHIEALATMAKKQTDPAVIRMAITDWRVRHNMAAQEKEPVAIDAYLAALRLEREAVQQARAVNTKEYERLQNQVISSAGMLALAEQLRTQLEQARALLNEATLKSMALETRRESLPIYRVTILGRGD
jgi:hypothetical protein